MTKQDIIDKATELSVDVLEYIHKNGEDPALDDVIINISHFSNSFQVGVLSGIYYFLLSYYHQQGMIEFEKKLNNFLNRIKRD